MEEAALYLEEGHRYFTEATYHYSEAQRLVSVIARNHARVSVDRKRLAHELREMEQQRQELEMRSRQLDQAFDNFAAREAGLATMEAELTARETELQALEGELEKKNRKRQSEIAPPAFPDSGPMNLRPNPMTARTPPEFLEALTQFRVWNGNRSLRLIADQSGQRISASNVRNILNGTDLPDRLEVIDAIVQGCGGSEDDRREYVAAWRRLYMSPPNNGRKPDSRPAG